MQEWERIAGCMPAHAGQAMDWEGLKTTSLGPIFRKMEQTEQNPVWHGEGNVWNHTKMVAEALVAAEDFWRLEERKRQELLLAALLHDMGKTRTTVWQDGAWTSPNHARTGAQMVREYLWRECGLCGTPRKQRFRETVCSLVRYHMVPVHLIERRKYERQIRQIASEGILTEDFSWELLCRLSEADMRGKIAADIEERIEDIQLCAAAAEEQGCLREPPAFASACTRRACLAGRNVLPWQELYDASWGEVVLMSGLPGTGKDTWIREHFPDLPMISLDEIRRELGIRPTEPQGAVGQRAQELAKGYLRRKQPFVWNATDLTADLRQKEVELFERYGARVRIVYLETSWDTMLERNRSREAEVAGVVIGRMLEKLAPPTAAEAQTVEWFCV